MKIGIVDLDTSHPDGWIPIEREMGHEIAGVWDGGSVYPAGYADKFAAERGIPRVYSSLDEMAAEIDCAIIHSCDWDTHIEKARPFVEAGKSVMVDKPLAGNLRDLEQLKLWAAAGARITGGSSLRFCAETQEWLARPVEERGTPDTVLCGCAVDDFNYGIHAYSMLLGIMGSGAQSVRHLGQGVQRRVQVNWPGGRAGYLIVGQSSGWIPFYASITSDKCVAQFLTDSTKLYRSLLETTLPYLSGRTEEPPVPMDGLIEAELCALAARQSWLEGDCEVPLSGVRDEGGYDGAAFAAEYRRMKTA